MAHALATGTLEEIVRLRARYPKARSALMPALYAAQAEQGYLTEGAMRDVGELLGVPITDVISVATFYEMFHLEPPGRHHIRFCTSLSCFLNRCDPVLDHLCARLGIGPGGTTDDGRVTLETVQCLGACEEAPVMLLDGDRHARLTPAKIDDVLSELS